MSEAKLPRIPPISVLTYHNIVAPGCESPNDLHSIAIDRLNEHVAALDRAGFVQVSLAAAFEVLVRSRDHAPGYVLTFDDGYVSLLRYAADLSSEIRPTLFILTGYTGRSTLSWNPRSSVILEHLDLDGLCRLAADGFDLQMHGLDHHNLLKFDAPQLEARFREANAWFRAHLGQDPEYLAYPYGYCDERVQGVVSQFYRGALSMSHGAWVGEGARYALNRVGIPYYLTGEDVVAVLKSPPESRWYEIEGRAPWRKNP